MGIYHTLGRGCESRGRRYGGGRCQRRGSCVVAGPFRFGFNRDTFSAHSRILRFTQGFGYWIYFSCWWNMVDCLSKTHRFSLNVENSIPSRIAMWLPRGVFLGARTQSLNSWKLKGRSAMSSLGLHAQISWQISIKRYDRYVNTFHSMYFCLKHARETHAKNSS